MARRVDKGFLVNGIMLLISTLVIAYAFHKYSAEKKPTKEGFLTAPEWMGILGAIVTIVAAAGFGIVW